MKTQLFIANCDLIGLMAHQPYVGFEFIKLDGTISNATRPARKLSYGDAQFNPTGESLEHVEGREVAREQLAWVKEVCETRQTIVFEQVRRGRLMTKTMWPIVTESHQPLVAPDAVIVMLTYSKRQDMLASRIGIHPTVSIQQAGLMSGVPQPASSPSVLWNQSTPAEFRQSTLAEFRSFTGPIRISQYASWGPLDVLTRREREVLVLVGYGLSQKEIAERLNVTAKTIETHRMRLGKKLDVATGAELVRIACDSGLRQEHCGLAKHVGAAWMAERSGDVSNAPTPS